MRTLQRDFLAPNFAGCNVVCEFGCGTGFNLASLATLKPEVGFAGFDFSPSAVELVRTARRELDLQIYADEFDMTAPPPAPLEPAANMGAFTFGAIEQLAGNFHAFIDYLLALQPLIVAHVEPVIELYDPANLVDALALRFHRKRGYTEGLLPYLQAHPKIDVLKVERAHFGSLMMEGYSRILWRPK